MIKFNESIKNKLDFFLKTKKIPNIIFHGTSGSGKRTIVNEFVFDIYDRDKSLIPTYVMNVNCAHGKGIKFIREELKFFAKTHINNIGTTCYFKTIILSNADKLTIDAQSALRRCIELFSHNTRFFIIVEDKYKLLKPIISRFCEIFITEPVSVSSNGVYKRINLHKYNIQKGFAISSADKSREVWLTKKIQEIALEQAAAAAVEQAAQAAVEQAAAAAVEQAAAAAVEQAAQAAVEQAAQAAQAVAVEQAAAVVKPNTNLFDLSIQLYEKGYSGLDLINYIEKDTMMMEAERKFHILLFFQKIKKDFRNEKLFILFILQFLLFRSEKDLENISFM
jgi:DNA polymerase III delta prime subunit